MSAVGLRFDAVTKRYRGSARPALDELSFEVPRGTLTGFVGHNGAGKTTAFALVSAFLLPDAGKIDVLGKGPFDPRRDKGMLGVLPQDAELPDRHSPRELLRHLARLQGMGAAAARVEVDRILEAVRMTDRWDDPIAKLSHGMRRRVAIASALVGKPPLVLLDEPLSGLDPLQAHALRAVLSGLRGLQTVVVSSHDLADLERMSDWVIMLRNGKCLRQGTLATVTDQTQRVRWELAPGGTVPLEGLAQRLPGHSFRLEGDALLQEAPDGALDDSSVTIMGLLAEAGIALRRVQRGIGLEQRFIADVDGES